MFSGKSEKQLRAVAFGKPHNTIINNNIKIRICVYTYYNSYIL